MVGKDHKTWKWDIYGVILDEIIEQLPNYTMWYPSRMTDKEWTNIRLEMVDLAKKIKEWEKVRFACNKIEEKGIMERIKHFVIAIFLFGVIILIGRAFFTYEIPHKLLINPWEIWCDDLCNE